MRAIGYRDIIIYFVFSLLYTLNDYGIGHFLIFLVNLLKLAANIFYRYVTDRYILPYGLQNELSKRCTTLAFCATVYLEHVYKNLDNPLNKLFINEKAFKVMRAIRFFREIEDGLGDIKFQNNDDAGGTYIYSESRKDSMPLDLLMIYIPGIYIVSPNSVEVYLEYLAVFLIHLQEQGFRNPAILIPKIKSAHSLDVDDVVDSLARFSIDTLANNENCKLALAGESMGFPFVFKLAKEVSNTYPIDLILLVSPVVQLQFEDTASSLNFDYLDQEILEKWAAINGEYLEIDRKTGSSTILWDKKVLPTQGFIVSYGELEMLSGCIKTFTDSLQDDYKCKVKLNVMKAHIHNWGLLDFYTEYLIDHREESLFLFSSQIARMLLSTSNSFFSGDTDQLVRNVGIDEYRVY